MIFTSPYPHSIIDNFFPEDLAKQLESEFPNYQDSCWHVYDNAIENKKTCNDWNKFPELTYRTFKRLVERYPELFSDPGLHGGGWHIHASGGNLNPHLDYTIHPKLKLQRKANLIVYLSSVVLPEHGGHFGFWKNGKLIKEIQPKFNRAILFDTTDAWHGMSRPFIAPEGVYRKSMAVYYLCKPDGFSGERERALFTPRDEQKGNLEVEELIRKRSDVNESLSVYKKSS
jgi:hypothetical protein